MANTMIITQNPTYPYSNAISIILSSPINIDPAFCYVFTPILTYPQKKGTDRRQFLYPVRLVTDPIDPYSTRSSAFLRF